MIEEKHRMYSASKGLILLSVALFLINAVSVNAQPPAIPVECGTIVDGEVTETQKIQTYALNLAPGDVVSIQVVPIGNIFPPEIKVFDPAGSLIGAKYGRNPGVTATTDVGVSATGEYAIQVYGWGYIIGAYTLYIGCTLRDGTVINPGDIPQEVQPTQVSGETPVNTNFSGNGFPGLPPVDFTNVARIPLIANTPMTGAVTPTGGEILGYTLDANAGDKLDLAFTRLSGNLNLGLVVLSAENQVVFQASLVTSETMSSRFTLPTAGQYTIGVFRIDLLPPAAPEPTAFQVQGTLNP